MFKLHFHKVSKVVFKPTSVSFHTEKDSRENAPLKVTCLPIIYKLTYLKDKLINFKDWKKHF